MKLKYSKPMSKNSAIKKATKKNTNVSISKPAHNVILETSVLNSFLFFFHLEISYPMDKFHPKIKSFLS